jgi:copper chaperone CopZ
MAHDTEAHDCCTPKADPGPTACPACGSGGKAVKAVTLRALLKPHLRHEIRDAAYRFCPNPSCALVYYSADGSQTFARGDLTVRVGVKETGSPRPLCYCFDHSAESIREEWAATGRSTVLEAIKAQVKAGTCRCEETNPTGVCCLGDIVKEVNALGRCNPSPSKPKGTQGRTIWPSLGLGVLASACCWLPLALAGLGVATGMLGAKIVWMRPWALGGLLILLLGVVGWWARKRFAETKSSEARCQGVRRFPALEVGILGISFALVWASPRLLHPGRNTSLSVQAPFVSSGGTLLILSTPQFDCPPCVGTLPKAMAATPGVASVRMDFEKRETHVVFQLGAGIDEILAKWKQELGFEGREIQRLP